MAILSALARLISPYLVPIIVGVALTGGVWFAWNHYENVVEERDEAVAQVELYREYAHQLQRGLAAVEEQTRETEVRQEQLDVIRREVHEHEPDAVPDDIGAVLRGLRGGRPAL